MLNEATVLTNDNKKKNILKAIISKITEPPFKKLSLFSLSNFFKIKKL